MDNRLIRMSIFGVFFLLLCWHLDALNITIMEARNFVTAREMINDGHYLIPTLNGEYRLAKPPLPTWLTAGCAALFSLDNLFALRLPAILFGFIGVFFATRIYRMLLPKQDDLLSGAILVTSFYYFLSSRSGMWDIFAQASMIGAIYYYMSMVRSSNGSIGSAFGLALCFAVSIMSKGPVAPYALFLPFLLSFHFAFRSLNWTKRKVSLLIVSILASLLLAAAWPLYIAYSEAGQAASAILQKESANWSSYNVKPFYYYWSFPSQSGIWTVLGFLAVIFGAIRYKRISISKPVLFFFLWTIFVFILLSVIPEKKSRYLLPILIPLALYLSSLLQLKDLSARKLLRIGQILTGSVFAIAGGLLAFFPHEMLDGFSWRVFGGLCQIAIGCGIIMLAIKQQLKKSSWALFAGMASIILLHIGSIGDVFNSKEAVRSFDTFQTDSELSRLPLYSLVPQRPELVWQIGRISPVIRSEELNNLPDTIGVFSFEGIQEEVEPEILNRWTIQREERFDQNPRESAKKANIALKRYFAILTRNTNQ